MGKWWRPTWLGRFFYVSAWLEQFFYVWGRSIQRRPKFWTVFAALFWISLVTGAVWLIYYFGEVP